MHLYKSFPYFLKLTRSDFRHVVRVGLFTPQSSSVMQKVTSFFTSTYPEFVDPRVVARAEGRESTFSALLLLFLLATCLLSSHTST